MKAINDAAHVIASANKSIFKPAGSGFNMYTAHIPAAAPLMLTKRWSCHVKTRFLHLRKSWKELTSAKHEAITLVVKKTYTRLLWYFSAESCLGPPTQDISTFPQRKRSFRRSGLKIWTFCPLYKTLFFGPTRQTMQGTKIWENMAIKHIISNLYFWFYFWI